MLDVLLYVLAGICFALAFFGVRVHRTREFNLLGLGLLLITLAWIIHEIDALD